jgi:hemolysin III
MISKIREPFNSLSHLGGAIVAFICATALIFAGWGGTAKNISLIVYALSVVILFSASAVYHLANVKPSILEVLRKVDHSAIYLLIAGTYTPICVNAFTGFFRWGLLTIIWVIAISGILVKVFYMNAPRWVNAGGYVLMGWLCISAASQMFTTLSHAALAWLIIGGLIYTFGAVGYSFKLFNFAPGKFGFHEVWHIFVLLGAAAHFIAVTLLILKPV